MTILKETRIYVAACKDERIRRLPEQLEKLWFPYTLEKVLPSSTDSLTAVLDAPSKRFREQLLTAIDRPLLWLEDDIDVPDNFSRIWLEYEHFLPTDWKIAVFGWGLVYGYDVKIRQISNKWWHLEEGNPNYGSFGGAQAILINSGDWRELLRGKEFRCDSMLGQAMKDIGLFDVYHTDTIIIGTNDSVSTLGNAVVTYEKLSRPRYWSDEGGYREIQASDFVS